MTAISSLQSIHKKGIFGDHHKQNQKDLTQISEIKNLNIINIVKYKKSRVELENIDIDGLKISKLTSLLSRPGKEPLEVKYLCKNLISKATNSQEIQNSILRIKETMNFYYFSQFLEETGIPRAVVFPFNEELKGLTRDLNDS